MQQESNIRTCEFTPHNESPDKFRQAPQSSGSSRRHVKTHLEDHKRRVQYTPGNSPDKYRKTPQSSVRKAVTPLQGSSRRDTKSQQEDIKRKAQLTPGNESPEKIRRTTPNSKLVNVLISKWSKHMGTPMSLTPIARAKDSQLTDEMREEYANQGRKVQILQKKLQEATETISSLKALQDVESRFKEETLEKISAVWESIEIITNHCNCISESLTGFQHHHANLSALYDNVISVNKSTIENLQQQLSEMKMKDEEEKKLVVEAENKLIVQAKRIEEMMLAQEELKKQLEYTENKSMMDLKHLEGIHAEEKQKLIKNHEALISTNEKLQSQLQKEIGEKENLSESFVEKDKHVSKLQEEIYECKNRIQELICQNTELTTKYGESIERGDELTKEIQSKVEEVQRLRENLDARQKIESDLAKDLDLIEKKYTDQLEQYKDLQNNLTHMEKKLKEKEIRNTELQSLIDEMRSDNKRQMLELNKKLDAFEENEHRLLEKQAKIEEIKVSNKFLLEKHAKEMAELKKDYEKKLSEMKNAVTTQNSAVTKLNQTLEKANAENQTLREKLHHVKEYNDKLQSKLKERSEALAAKTIAATELENIDRTYETRFNTTAATLKSTQNLPEMNAQIKEHNNKSLYSEAESIYSPEATKAIDDIQKASSQFTTKVNEKKLRFDVNSSPEILNEKETFFFASQGRKMSQVQSISKSQLQSRATNEEGEDAQRERKFFKSRGTGVKKYGNQRKASKKQ